jgi:hypothetical protein
MNHYQARTSPSKLRGRFYTPDEFVRLILDAVPVTTAGLIVDPSCGDGQFLCGVVEAVANNIGPAERAAAAVQLARRLVGFDTDACEVEAAQARLADAFRSSFGVELSEDQLGVYSAGPLARSFTACWAAGSAG